MSWTWRDLERDDSLWRFQANQPNNENFFQSGRHAAEERFWKLKIHEDGSFRHRNASSMDNFYTIKDALRKEEEAGRSSVELQQRARREASIEENSRKSTEPGDESSTTPSTDSTSSSSESSSDSDQEGGRDGELRHKKKKKKQKKKGVRKEMVGEAEEVVYKSDVEKGRAVRQREHERRESEKLRELERRERELLERERELERRSREQTPDYSYYNRSRRNSDISNKDYPYSIASDYAPSIAPIQEENDRKARRSKDGNYPYETYSTRYY